MKRVAGMLGVLYVLAALGTSAAEKAGLMRCGCTSDCWCKRRFLSAFRWVFPWHR